MVLEQHSDVAIDFFLLEDGLYGQNMGTQHANLD